MPLFLKKIRFSNIFWWAFYLACFSILINSSLSYLDPDFAWHKKVGEQIVLDKQVPSENIYNFSFTGNWVDHEWLSDAIVFLIDKEFGYLVLSALFALLIVITLRLLHLRIKKYWPGLPNYFSAIFQIFSLIACLPHFGVRIQEFALLFLLLTLNIIDSYLEKRNKHILFFFIPLMWLWSTFHGSFLIGFFVMGLFVFVQLISKTKYLSELNNNFLSWKELKIFSFFSFLSFLVTFLSPYGAELYSFLYGYKDSYYLTHIQEWLPQHFFPFLYSQLLFLVFIVLSLIFHFYENYNKKKNFDLWNFILVFVFTFLAFKSRRHFPLLIIAGLPFVLKNLGEALELEKIKQSSLFLGNSFYKNILGFILIISLVFISLTKFSVTTFDKNVFANHCQTYPCGAIKFLQENKIYDSEALFNSYGWGGFLIHELPERKIFIDGRLPQVEYKGHSFLEEYYRFYSEDKDEIAGRLQEHNISLVLIEAFDKDVEAKKWEKIIFNLSDEDLRAKNYLREYLNDSSDWEIIYQDEVSVIYRQISAK